MIKFTNILFIIFLGIFIYSFFILYKNKEDWNHTGYLWLLLLYQLIIHFFIYIHDILRYYNNEYKISVKNMIFYFLTFSNSIFLFIKVWCISVDTWNEYKDNYTSYFLIFMQSFSLFLCFQSLLYILMICKGPYNPHNPHNQYNTI